MIRALRDTYRSAFAGLPRRVWLLSIAQLVNRSGTMVLPYLTLWLTQERGFSAKAAGQTLGLYGAGAIAGAYLGGVLVDRIRATRVMLLSFALTGLGFLTLLLVDTTPAILATLLGTSIAAEALRPAASSALAQCAAPGDRIRAYALYRLAINLGMTFGPTIGGFLAMRNYAWLFLANGSTCLTAAALFWLFFRREMPLPPPVSAAGHVARSPWRDPPYMAFLALMTVFATVVFQLSSTYTLFVHRDLGYSEGSLGLLFGANTLIIVLVEMVIVNRLRGVSPLRLLGPGCFLFGAGFALMPLSATFGWLLCTVVVWTVGEMIALPLVESIAADRAEERRRGSYMGLLTVSFGIAFMVAPVVGTWVYEEHGGDVLWYGCGIVGAALWGGFAILRPHLFRTPPAA